MKELVRLTTRPSRDGKAFVYLLDYIDENGKGRRISLGHADRYDFIQNLRRQGKPAPTARNKLITNFSTTFGRILKKAGVGHREFHDLRSTAITNWLYNGLKEHEVMRLAGHASFETTHRFYLAVQPDLYERARQANTTSVGEILAHIWRVP